MASIVYQNSFYFSLIQCQDKMSKLLTGVNHFLGMSVKSTVVPRWEPHGLVKGYGLLPHGVDVEFSLTECWINHELVEEDLFKNQEFGAKTNPVNRNAI